MGQKRILSPETPVRSFPTPNIEDLVVIQDVDSRLPGYKPLDYGTPHPDQTRFKGAKLVYQEPLENSDTFVRRIYATDRLDQDAYNYAIKYSAGSPDHPIYIRTYVVPRADYFPLPEGTADSFLENAFLVEEEMAPVEGELNSLYVRVTRVYETLPGPILTSFETNDAGQKVTVTTQRKPSAGYNLPAASATSSPSAQTEDTGVVTEQIRSVTSIFARPQFSAERPDPLPTKFRAAVPDVETSSIVAGTAQQPTLAVPQDLSASEAQETEFLKRVSRRLRPDPNYPVTFVETTRVNTGQIATVTSVLEDFLQSADSGPLIESSEVTDLGDGRSIKVTTEVDQVFEQPSFTRAKEDLTPPKFRASVSETIEERTIPGVASMPANLAANEFSKTEEQLTVDRKRVRTQERDITETDTLVEQVVTPEGQLATRTLILSDQEQFVSPSATLIQGEVEQLGDGRTVKTEVEVAEVFDERRVSKEKPDLVPQEFRGAVPTEVTESVSAGDSVSMPDLGPGELSRSAQRVTAQKIRESVTTRPSANFPVTLVPSDTLIDPDGVRVTRVKTLAEGAQTLTPSATVSGSVENLGDGLTVKTEDTKAEVFAGASFTTVKEDLTPQKFRASVAEQVEEATAPGTAAMPGSLSGDEFEKAEQQVTKFTKRTRVRRRQIAAARELEEALLTNEGQLATRRLTLVDGPQSLEPKATVIQGEIELLGDGRTVKTEVEVDEVFDERRLLREKPDLIPQEFRGAVPTETTESVAPATTVTMPVLGPGELSRSAQRLTTHKVRSSVTTRPATALPVTLNPSDVLVDNDGVTVTRVKTLAVGAQTFTPSATVSGSVENIGDGLTVRTQDIKAEVFAGGAFTRTKEDLTPAKFRASVSEQVEESTTTGTAVMPAGLSPDEYEKSEQQVTKFTKRTRVRRRQISEAEEPLEEQIITNDGQLATRILTLSDGPQTLTTGATVVSGEVEQLGDGRTVKTEVVVPDVFGRASFAQERPDVIPAEFRDQIPTTTTEITEEGQASAVSLTGDEIAKTQEQVTADTRRTRVVTRSNSLTTDSLTGRAFNTEWGVPELIVDSIVDPATQPDPGGLVLQDQITPLNSTRSRRVRRELQAVPANYIYYEVAQDQVVIKNEVSLHRRDVTDPADPTFLPVPVVVGAIADITDTPLEFPWVRRVTKRLPTNSVGDIILPEARIEYDTITYTFPGIIYTWKARYTGDQVRANLSFFDNRYPVSMTVAARYEVTYHVLDAGDPDDDPDLNLSNPAARNNFEFFRVITRPWARIFFSIPDNTIHPPAPITLAKESVDRGGVAFDIQGGQSSEPVAYTPGDLILVGGEVKKYWGNIYTKRLVYVREPV
jgi:hypothetical protein